VTQPTPRKFPFSEVHRIWVDGELVAFEDATVHVLTHALHYGSGVFEGIRAYDTPDGPAVFRLPEHVRRLAASCKLYRMELAYGHDELCAAVLATLRANDLGRCYIRPLVIRGFGSMGVNPLGCPLRVVIAAWPTRDRFLGAESADEGIDVCVSSWRRPPPDAQPASAKATANYLNSQLVTLEALTNGYQEGIALDVHGNVAEGSAENLFLVQDGALWTPPVASSILAGITRDAILTLAREAGLPVHEMPIPRALLYACDELFCTGTSVEVTPIRSVDRIPVGEGRPGPVTRRLTDRLMAIACGEADDTYGWRTAVYAGAAAAAVVKSASAAG
jgi:branched-chain amino acid aminotransferase